MNPGENVAMGEGALDLTGGRVLDPGQGIDATATVTWPTASSPASDPVPDAGAVPGEPGRRRTVDAAGLLVTPGLVDLHTHLYPGVSHYGIEPDTYCAGRGVTTAVDAGSAGAQTFPGLRRYVIERSRTRILAFLNIAVQGMISSLVGELEDIRWGSPEQAIARARENPDLIVGIKVRLGYQMVGNDPGPALRLAREAADALGLPLMVHVIDIRPSLDWLLPYLGRGDVVTHCFHGNEGGILDAAAGCCPRRSAPGSAACCSTWGTGWAASPTGSRGPRWPRGSPRTRSPATCTRTTSTGPSSIRRPRCRSCCTSGCRSPTSSGPPRRHRPRRCAGRAGSARWPPAGTPTCRSSSCGTGTGRCPTRRAPPRSSSGCSSRGW